MSDEIPAFDRFVTLAKRELGADDIRLLSIDEATPDAGNTLVTRLGDGRHIVASFNDAPKDRDALERRLAMLTSTFEGALTAPTSDRTRARMPVGTSLHEELKALAARARAVDAIVIDTDSPVVWGCASVPARPRARNELLLREVSDRELSSQVGDDQSGELPEILSPHQDVAAESATDVSSTPPRAPLESSYVMSEIAEEDVPEESEATKRAITAIRALPALEGLHKGKHLRHVEREGAYYLALSFSGIYILVLVFDDAFDELRASSAASESLPRVERLVLALPPLDPEPPVPMGGVVALRGRRPRR